MRKKNNKLKRKKPLINISKAILWIIIIIIIAAITSYFVSTTNNSGTENKPFVKIPASKLIPQKPAVIGRKLSKKKTILEGNWINKKNGALLDFFGNKFNADFPSVDNHKYFEGFFEIKNNEITFSIHKKNNPCKTPGSYRFRINSNKLFMEVKKDTCIYRVSKLNGIWKRL